MWSLVRNSIRFTIATICFLLVSNNNANCAEFELLYAKPYPNMFFTSKGSKNIVLVSNTKVILIDSDNGNIIFTKTIGDIRRTDFVAIDEKNNRLFLGYVEFQRGYRIDIYDTKNQLLLKRFSLQPDTVLTSDISPDNRYVVVIDNHYNARIYDLENDTLVYDFQREIDKYLFIYYAKFSNNGKKMALLTGTKVFIYNFGNKEIEKEINSVSYHVHRVVFSNSDDYLLRYNYGSSVEVFDIATGEKFKTFEHTGEPWYVTLNENDNILISTAINTAYFWDFNKGEIVDSLNKISRISLLKLDNKEYLVVNDGSVSLWDVKTRLFYKTIVPTNSLNQFVAGGSYFVSRAVGRDSKIFNTITGEKVKDIGNARTYLYLADTSIFYYYANDTIYIGNILTGNTNETHYYPISGLYSYINFSNNLEYLSYIDTNRTMYVVDWKTKEVLYKIDSALILTYRAFNQANLLFSKNNRYVAGIKGNSLSTKRLFFVADGKSGNILFQYSFPSDTSFAFAFSYDEKYLFFRSGNNPVNQINIERKEIVKIFNEVELQGRTILPQIGTFPDRPWLAITSFYDPNITIIDYDRNRIVARLLGDIYYEPPFVGSSSVYALIDISSDGNYLLAEYRDIIIIWKVPTYSPVEENPRNDLNKAISIIQDGNTNQIQININLDRQKQINFSVYDLLGRVILSTQKKEYLPGTYSETLDLSRTSIGWYILTVQVETEIETFKISIIK